MFDPQRRRDRRAEAVRLRRLGLTYGQIGNELGITGSAANQLVRRWIRLRAREHGFKLLDLAPNSAIYSSNDKLLAILAEFDVEAVHPDMV